MPWSDRLWRPGVSAPGVPCSLALQALKSHRNLHLSIIYSHVSTCWLCRPWLRPPSFSVWAEAPECTIFPIKLPRRRHSQSPIQSTSWTQKIHKEGLGQTKHVMVKTFSPACGRFGSWLLPPHNAFCQRYHSLNMQLSILQYLSFFIALVSSVYWLNVLKTRVYNPSTFVSVNI